MGGFALTPLTNPKSAPTPPARTHTVPEVRYAYKRERDTTGARAVRSILGFAWRTEPIDNDLANADDTHPNEPAPTEEANEPKRAPKRARPEEEPVHEAMRDFAA